MSRMVTCRMWSFFVEGCHGRTPQSAREGRLESGLKGGGWMRSSPDGLSASGGEGLRGQRDLLAHPAPWPFDSLPKVCTFCPMLQTIVAHPCLFGDLSLQSATDVLIFTSLSLAPTVTLGLHQTHGSCV